LFVVLLVPANSVLGSKIAHRRQDQYQRAYDKAFSLLQSGRPNEALAEVDAALVADPNNPSLYNLRGLVNAKLGRIDDAEASFRKVVQLEPRLAMGYNNLGTLLWQSGRYDAAAEVFREGLAIEPSDFTGLVGLGTTLDAMQRYAEAAPYLKAAWLSHPEDLQASYEWAHVLRELKRPAEASEVLKRVRAPEGDPIATRLDMLSAVVAEDLGDLASAHRLYLRAYDKTPQSFEIYLGLVRTRRARDLGSISPLPPAPTQLSAEQHFALGLMLASQSAYAEAIDHFEATMRMEPDSYSAGYNLALAYKRAGKPEPGINVLERGVKEHPTGELYNLLASLEEDAGRYVEAARYYRQAVELEPTREQYYFDLGAEYLVHLAFGAALDVFRVGSQKFPDSPRQYVGMGLAQFSLRQYAQAARSYLSALDINPSSPDAFAAWKALPPFLAGAEWEQIRPLLEQLADHHPHSPQALYCYAAALFQHNLAIKDESTFDLVKSLLARAIRLNPKFVEAHLEIANLYEKRKQPREAIASFLEAIRLDPTSEIAHYQLGQAYRDSQRFDLAEQELTVYGQLSRRHREKMAQTLHVIRQFVLTQPDSVVSTSTPK